MPAKKDPRLARAGVSGFNKPKRTPNHPKKSHVVVAKEGDKVKITLRFRGREMAHQDLGRDLLERIAEDVTEFGKIENMPKLEGRQMVMMIGPAK